MIHHVITSVTHALPSVPVIVVTSREPSDDPLGAYVATLGVPVFRGPLDDVFERFRLCVAEYPCDWILRLSADSPLLPARVLRAVTDHAQGSTCDLVTTVFPRTFPKGHNAELIRVQALMGVNPDALEADDREHVTPFFYRNAEQFRIVSVESGVPSMAELSLSVDTLEDLRRLEQWTGVALAAESYELLTSRVR